MGGGWVLHAFCPPECLQGDEPLLPLTCKVPGSARRPANRPVQASLE